MHKYAVEGELVEPGITSRVVTAEEIEAAKTPKGAWTRAQLAQWGVPWPPPKGWKQALIAGTN